MFFFKLCPSIRKQRIVINSVGCRLQTQPSHGYCPALVPPLAEIIDLYIIVRLYSCVFQAYYLMSSSAKKEYAAHPLLYIRVKKVNTAILVYDKQKRIARTYYTLDIYPLKNRSISQTLEIYPLKNRSTSQLYYIKLILTYG